MPTDPVVDGYLKSVAEELDAAERLNSPPPHRLASYHLQQAAEKLTKAICLHRGHLATKEHRVGLILESLDKSDPWRAKLDPLDDYSQYATTYRYPTTVGRLKQGLGEREIQVAIESIRTLLTEAQIECSTPYAKPPAGGA